MTQTRKNYSGLRETGFLENAVPGKHHLKIYETIPFTAAGRREMHHHDITNSAKAKNVINDLKITKMILRSQK